MKVLTEKRIGDFAIECPNCHRDLVFPEYFEEPGWKWDGSNLRSKYLGNLTVDCCNCGVKVKVGYLKDLIAMTPDEADEEFYQGLVEFCDEHPSSFLCGKSHT